MSVLACLFVLLLGVVAIFYLYSKWTYTYWRRRGIPSVEPQLFYGNIKDLVTDVKSLSDLFSQFYKTAKAQGHKHVGIYVLLAKLYVPIDMELIRNLLQKDFVHFMNHGFFYINEKVDPLSGHLFNLENDKWKHLRAKLTPTFTSGKLKMMCSTMVDCTLGLVDILNDHSKIGDAVDIKQVIGRFTTDVVGSCAFGLDCNSLKNPNSDFLYYGKRFFNPTLYERFKGLFLLVLPRSVLDTFAVKAFATDITNFYTEMVSKTIKHREENNIFRKDFFHLMLQLRNKGKLTDDESVKKEGNEDPTLSIGEFTAQCFVFLAAGFETSATTMTFALLELALNQDIQDQLREDIFTTLAKHNGKLTYKAIMDMSYLNKVVFETTRKHPPVAGLARICTKEYRIPESDVVIEKNTLVHIPIAAIHRDPEYYPDPDKFDPERFSEENKAKRPQCSYLTFGEGPRICIGARFGIMQVKVGLTTIIKNFKITLNEKTCLPIEYETKLLINSVKGGIWLNVSRIE